MEAEDSGGGALGPSQVDEAEGEDIRDNSGSTALEEMGYIDSGGSAGGTDETTRSVSTVDRVKGLNPRFVLGGVILFFVVVWLL